tara:strand:+ start:330 stop:656 length:327 start_codon:yes stop_codon:yes gene_type:complete
MKDRIKTTIERLKREKNPPTFYLEKLDNLLTQPSKTGWVNTGQYHNAYIFKKHNPNFSITQGVKQVMFYAGEYVVELLPDNIYKWEECIYSSLNDVEDCIWEKEKDNE